MRDNQIRIDNSREYYKKVQALMNCDYPYLNIIEHTDYSAKLKQANKFISSNDRALLNRMAWENR